MNELIVDASVAVQWVVDEEHSLRAQVLLGGPTLLAPAHWLAEAGNAVLNKARRGTFTHQIARQRVAALAKSPVKSIALSGLMHEALALALAHAMSVYDGLYVALAVERNALLITADVKLLRKLRQAGMSGVAAWIGSYEAETGQPPKQD